MKKIIKLTTIFIGVFILGTVSVMAATKKKTYSMMKRSSINNDVSISGECAVDNKSSNSIECEGESAIRWFGKSPFNADKLQLTDKFTLITKGEVTLAGSKVESKSSSTYEKIVSYTTSVKNRWCLRNFYDYEIESSKSITEMKISVYGVATIGGKKYSINTYLTKD